jgi:hypothetical protein
MLDSLVRVSRRVGWDPTSTLRSGPPRVRTRLSLQKKRALPGGDRSRPGSTVEKRRARKQLGANRERKLANGTPRVTDTQSVAESY